jgi:hypothetical protein
MRSKNLGPYAVALAIAVVGAVWAGLPAIIVLVLALLLACPLMMFFMMRGMHSGAGHDAHAARPREECEYCGLPQPNDHRHHDSLR